MIKVGGQFSGVGAFDQALKRLNIKYENIYQAEWDKYARQTYLHNYEEPIYYVNDVNDTPTQEITEKYGSLDIAMFSPPCQAFSLAGKRLGKEDKRGILFFNSHEFIQINKPRFFIFENVKGLLSDDGGKTFSEWINMLGGKSVNGNAVLFPYEDAVPYHIYWQVLNAKDYGVPQNRERVFIIGIRDDEDNSFRFPIEEKLIKRLKDVLEDDVDEKFFLSEKMIDWITIHRQKRESQNNFPMNENDIGNCVTARYFKMGAEDPYIKIKSATSKGYEEATEGDSINFSVPNSETRRGRVGKQVAQTLDTGCQQGVMIGAFRGRNPENPSDRTKGSPTEQRLEINNQGTSNTITSVQKDNVVILEYNECQQGILQKYEKEIEQSLNQDICTGIDASYYKGFGVRQGKCRQVVQEQYKIRRLTPRECFRLMDFPDTFTWSVSDSQAYKQAGNSIVVNVLCKIINNLKINKQ